MLQNMRRPTGGKQDECQTVRATLKRPFPERGCSFVLRGACLARLEPGRSGLRTIPTIRDTTQNEVWDKTGLTTHPAFRCALAPGGGSTAAMTRKRVDARAQPVLD